MNYTKYTKKKVRPIKILEWTGAIRSSIQMQGETPGSAGETVSKLKVNPRFVS
jgi:hypothetical protein